MLNTSDKETRAYRVTDIRGQRCSTSNVVNVECVEQRGKFYASTNSLNATRIGVGSTAQEAFDDWSNKVRCASVKLWRVTDDTENEGARR